MAEPTPWSETMVKTDKLLQVYLFAGILLLLLFSAPGSVAATLVVGTCKAAPQHFTKIQDAVNAAPAGSTIQVCPGTYAEQITINKQIALTGIQANNSDAAIIAVPAGGIAVNATDIQGGPVAAQIFVENATGVTISRLIVDGNGNGVSACSPNLEGIYFQNSSGTITDNAVRNQIAPSDEGCQIGLAINVESNSATAPAVTISNNSVRNYQKNGITAIGPGGGASGPEVTVTGNTVIGIGPTAAIAQNGIQISLGSTGKVTGNDVADDIYTGTTGAASSGILVFASAGVTVSNNTIENTQVGIATVSDLALGAADNASVTSNHIGGTQTFDAIDLCSNGNTAESNVIYGSAQSGIHSDDECTGPGSARSGNGARRAFVVRPVLSA